MRRKASPNRHRGNLPDTYPAQETHVPTPGTDMGSPADLALRSNGENDWQDEMPADRKRRVAATDPYDDRKELDRGRRISLGGHARSGGR